MFVGLTRKLVQGEVADEPRRVEAAAVKAVAGGFGDEAGGDVKRHGADDMAGVEAVDGTAVVIAQVDFDVPGVFLNADGAGVPGSRSGEAQHGLGRQGGEAVQAAFLAQQAGEVGEAVRPGKDGVAVVTARGEIVQAGIGGDGVDAVAVIVAAAVVEVPE